MGKLNSALRWRGSPATTHMLVSARTADQGNHTQVAAKTSQARPTRPSRPLCRRVPDLASADHGHYQAEAKHISPQPHHDNTMATPRPRHEHTMTTPW